MRKLTVGLVFLSTLFILPAAAIEAPSAELGKTLFEAAALGTSGRSCQTCHPAGKGLDKTGDFSDAELKDMINACIRDALKGTMLATDSQEMDALLNYVRTFQK